MITSDHVDLDDTELSRLLLFIAELVRRFLRGDSGPPPFRPDRLSPVFVKAIAMAIEVLEAHDAKRAASQKGRTRLADVIPFADVPKKDKQ